MWKQPMTAAGKMASVTPWDDVRAEVGFPPCSIETKRNTIDKPLQLMEVG